ncbi:hypothetical protein [Amycolatopsis sp. NPDC021455]|uniref:hypothetical protein n=1 Tax=Amycolatopsis sp. NPDC021455 TaxID=3154901 RepID=UPI0033D41F16
MVDNITLPASGAIVSTDDLGGGVQVQNVKNTFGPDGVMTPVTTTSGLPTTHTDNTNTANVLKGSDGTSAGQNAALFAGAYLSVPWTASGAGNYASTDAGNFRTVTVQIVSNAGTIYFEGSNDGTNWFGVTLQYVAEVTSSASGQVSSTTFSGGGFTGVLPTRYFRVRGSGTSTGIVLFHTQPAAPNTTTVSLNGTPSVAISGYTSGTVDGGTIGTARPMLSMVPMVHNGLNNDAIDRMRNNVSTALVAAGTTTTQTGKSVTTYNARSLTIVLNVSAVSGGSVTLTITGSTVSSYTYPLITGSAVTTTGVTVYRICPHLTAASGATAAEPVPRTVLVTATVSGSITYGIDTILSV